MGWVGPTPTPTPPPYPTLYLKGKGKGPHISSAAPTILWKGPFLIYAPYGGKIDMVDWHVWKGTINSYLRPAFLIPPY